MRTGDPLYKWMTSQDEGKAQTIYSARTRIGRCRVESLIHRDTFGRALVCILCVHNDALFKKRREWEIVGFKRALARCIDEHIIVAPLAVDDDIDAAFCAVRFHAIIVSKGDHIKVAGSMKS